MSMELLLPHPEVLLEIFYYLNGRDLYVCSAVCRTWKTLLDDERYPEASIWTMRLNKSSTPQFKASPFVAKLSGKEKLRVFENAWDNNAISENIYITDNQLTLHRRPIASSTDLARGKRGYLGGLHYWSVVWHGPQFGSNAIVGVATDKEKLHGEGYFSLLGNTSESWGWDLSKNLLRHNQETFGQYLSSDINIELKVGQTIGVILDQNNRTLSFELEQRSLGVAFTDLPPCKLYPAVSMVYGNTEASLIYHGQPLEG